MVRRRRALECVGAGVPRDMGMCTRGSAGAGGRRVIINLTSDMAPVEVMSLPWRSIANG